MKVQLVFQNNGNRNRIVKMQTLPRLGERLESGEPGTFIVEEVVHTPLSKNHDAVLVLLADNSGKSPA